MRASAFSGVSKRESHDPATMHDRGEQSTHSPPAYPVRPQRESAGPSRTNSGFSDLSLSDVPQDPNPENCLAHLKLLFTFQTLKNDVGGNDGLWDLWDADYPSVPEDPVMALAKVREKRWALFVARAVDRYESWWSSLGSQMLTERDMEKDRTRYLNFMANWEPMHWREETMPPLGTFCEPLSVQHGVADPEERRPAGPAHAHAQSKDISGSQYSDLSIRGCQSC